MDGRSDFYGDDFEEKCIDVLNVKYDWEKTLGGFGVDTILLPPSAPLAGALEGIQPLARRLRRRRRTGVPARAKDRGQNRIPPPPRGGTGRDREVTKTRGK